MTESPYDTLIPYKTWIVEFVDTEGHGKRALSGPYTKEEVIDFFGLNNSDVYEYNVYEFIEPETNDEDEE